MRKSMVFSFLLDFLEPLGPIVRPMFGCHMICVEDRMLFFTGDEDHLEDDFGICVATSPELAEDLRKAFPSLRPLRAFRPNESGGWLVLPVTAPDFELTAMGLCELALLEDPRVGRVSTLPATVPAHVAVSAPAKRRGARARAPSKATAAASPRRRPAPKKK